ncbi:RICIN domain-containing protein [Streptomyces sp. NBC_01565]|uniref:RICIN domain-containing protein n=1 Tax=unclassified Streptomyces TaxID=2593676 RepID=UPI00225431B6|nr:RICIN domain-containing protein [Streptomyces sp. NBC_01565]MCX4546245.1 RICIN domain-containing protein [Streptomyces sp. NBC_01565]
MISKIKSSGTARRLTALATASLAIAGGSLVMAPSASAASWSGSLWNYQTGLCLDGNGNAGPGSEVIQWECNGGSNQNWYAGWDAKGRPRIVNATNNLCLDRHDDTRMGAQLILWHCNDKWNQVFSFGGGTNAIVNTPLNQVVDVPGGTGTWGARPIMWEPNGGDNQYWVQHMW